MIAKQAATLDVDIDKMHAYRDAIRSAGDERVVSLPATLYPGPSVTSLGTGVDALSAVPGSSDVLDARLEAVIRAELERPATYAASAA